MSTGLVWQFLYFSIVWPYPSQIVMAFPAAHLTSVVGPRAPLVVFESFNIIIYRRQATGGHSGPQISMPLITPGDGIPSPWDWKTEALVAGLCCRRAHRTDKLRVAAKVLGMRFRIPCGDPATLRPTCQPVRALWGECSCVPMPSTYPFHRHAVSEYNPVLGGVFAQRGHSARTAPIITVIIQVTTLKTTHLRNHAQSIQNSKIQTSDACHGSQGPKFCPL